MARNRRGLLQDPRNARCWVVISDAWGTLLNLPSQPGGAIWLPRTQAVKGHRAPLWRSRRQVRRELRRWWAACIADAVRLVRFEDLPEWHPVASDGCSHACVTVEPPPGPRALNPHEPVCESDFGGCGRRWPSNQRCQVRVQSR